MPTDSHAYTNDSRKVGKNEKNMGLKSFPKQMVMGHDCCRQHHFISFLNVCGFHLGGMEGIQLITKERKKRAQTNTHKSILFIFICFTPFLFAPKQLKTYTYGRRARDRLTHTS